MAKPPAPRRNKRRRYRLSRIKANRAMDIGEVAHLLGVHPNTVRAWLKEGLEALDDSRPLLIHGTALKAFLETRQTRRRRTCASNEFYCFRCRQPRRAWGDMADLVRQDGRIAVLSALCCHCHGGMHRSFRCSDAETAGFLLQRPQPP